MRPFRNARSSTPASPRSAARARASRRSCRARRRSPSARRAAERITSIPPPEPRSRTDLTRAEVGDRSRVAAAERGEDAASGSSPVAQRRRAPHRTSASVSPSEQHDPATATARPAVLAASASLPLLPAVRPPWSSSATSLLQVGNGRGFRTASRLRRSTPTCRAAALDRPASRASSGGARPSAGSSREQARGKSHAHTGSPAVAMRLTIRTRAGVPRAPLNRGVAVPLCLLVGQHLRPEGSAAINHHSRHIDQREISERRGCPCYRVLRWPPVRRPEISFSFLLFRRFESLDLDPVQGVNHIVQVFLRARSERTRRARARAAASETPFAVQKLVLPDALAGVDVLAASPTGSGKTLAFGIPLSSASARRAGSRRARPRADARARLAGRRGARAARRRQGLPIAAVYGGTSVSAAGEGARRRHPRRDARPPPRPDRPRLVSLARLRVLVLDEVDRMLDMGFRPQVDRILAACRENRQTLLFSATLDGPVRTSRALHGRTPCAFASEGAGRARRGRSSTSSSGHGREQARAARRDAAADAGSPSSSSGRSTAPTSSRASSPREHGVRAAVMHGNMSQNARERSLAQFESGRVPTLSPPTSRPAVSTSTTSRT